ncbi:MAG: histidine triad nucleotide-binding protein [Thermoguttaceae bacterium]
MPTLFEKIISRDIPSTVVYEDDRVIAIRDIQPQAAVHVLVIPKKAIPSVNDIAPEDEPLVGYLWSVVRRIAEQEGVAERGYRVVVNCGQDGQQTVPHLHLHIIGGRQLSWPPG